MDRPAWCYRLQGVAIDVSADVSALAWLWVHRVVLVNEAAQDILTMEVEQWGGGDPVAGHEYLKVDATMRMLLRGGTKPRS